MQIIFFLIAISLLVATGFLFSFFWASRNGQFEDDCTPAMRMLFDDELITAQPEEENKTSAQ
jgi:cbb3-type cytochrome oxidase maturation protein